MQFMTALLGGGDNPFVKSAFALGLVLVFIVLGLWVLKFFTKAGSNMARGRNRRLTIVDSAMVDAKRQVIIIRRDNVEHLIMTGGPQDLVIESSVPVAEAPPPRSAAPPRPPKTPPPQRPVDIATPIVADHPVSREIVDRLHDLARPAPLRPHESIRHTGLMRPTARQDSDVIPMGPALRVDNSAGASSDSAKTAAIDGTNGHPRLLGRSRFFRSVPRGDRT